MNSITISSHTSNSGFQNYCRLLPTTCSVVCRSPFFYGLVGAMVLDQYCGKGALDTLLTLGIIPGLQIALGAILTQYFAKQLLANQSDSNLSSEQISGFLWVSILSGITGGTLTLLFVLPGIWWAIKASLAGIIIINEKTRVIESLKKSHEMTKGHFWETFRYLALPVLLSVGITAAAMLILFVLSLLKVPTLIFTLSAVVVAVILQLLGLAMIPLLVQLYGRYKKA